MNLAERQRSARDSAQRQAATSMLIEMKSQRAAPTAESERVEAAVGPIQYIAIMLGTDAETAVRWLIVFRPVSNRADDRRGEPAGRA
jgi:hypothetical protein